MRCTICLRELPTEAIVCPVVFDYFFSSKVDEVVMCPSCARECCLGQLREEMTFSQCVVLKIAESN